MNYYPLDEWLLSGQYNLEWSGQHAPSGIFAVVAAVAWLIICRLHELLKKDSRRKQAVKISQQSDVL